MTRLWSTLKPWLYGLGTVWAVLAVVTESQDPAAPLAALLVVLGGSLLLLGGAASPRPATADEEEERLFLVGVFAFVGVMAIAAGVWWGYWITNGEPRVFPLRLLAVAIVTVLVAASAGVLARAIAAARRPATFVRPRPEWRDVEPRERDAA